MNLLHFKDNPSNRDVISLFSGAMGLDIGLSKAGLNIVIGQDFDPACVATMRANGHKVLGGDIREINEEDLLEQTGLAQGEPFLICGGPPCQPFSTAGKRLGINDPRGSLFMDFIRMIDYIHPRFFIMENVKGIMSAPLKHMPLAERDKNAPEQHLGTVLDVPMDSGESFIPYLEEMESMGLTVHFRMPLLDRIEESCCNETSSARLCRDLGRCAGGNLVTMATIEPKLRDQILKRLMDILGSLVGCIISIPIIAITAIPLKLESPGPLFFKQKRVGRNGRVFYIHKLRSMYMDAEERKKELMAQNEMNGLMFKMQDDPRITKVGKFIRKTSIDELPQFFDVLRGDMSLVGTRPPTLDEYKQYESHHKRRLSMKPGITGLWQVSGRSDIEDFEDVVKLDVEYIDNWSLWGDIKILFKTVWVVFAGRGAK